MKRNSEIRSLASKAQPFQVITALLLCVTFGLFSKSASANNYWLAPVNAYINLQIPSYGPVTIEANWLSERQPDESSVTSVLVGEDLVLDWNAQNASNCRLFRASGEQITQMGSTGSFNYSFFTQGALEITLTCYGGDEPVSMPINLTVNPLGKANVSHVIGG